MPGVDFIGDITVRIGPVEVRLTRGDTLDELRQKRDTLADALKKIDEEIRLRGEKPKP